MSKVNLMTKAAYARHRGCSKVAVGQAVDAGRISLIDGLIDPVVADVQWAANSRVRASNNLGQVTQDAANNGPLFAGAPGGSPEPVKIDDYGYNRNRREAAEAERAELSLAEEKGQLIRVDAVKTALAAVFSATRDALLQLCDRLSSEMAAESDPAKCKNILQTEHHQVLLLLSGAAQQIDASTKTAP